jgi:hypothetical protein
MRHDRRPGICLTALAISACTGGDGGPSSRPREHRAVIAAAQVVRGGANQPEPESEPARPRSNGRRRAVAADLLGAGEPMVVVAGCRDSAGAAEVPVYAQRNGGWRRVTAGEWPAGDAAAVAAVDAADLDGDGALEVAALGSSGDGRAHLALYRMRDRDLALIAETSWRGRADRLEIAVDERTIGISGRHGRRPRAFALDGDRLVSRTPVDRSTPHRPHRLAMTFAAADGPLRVDISAAAGGPAMLSRIAAWNDELARLRPR